MENNLTISEFENTLNTKYEDLYKDLTFKAFLSCDIDFANKNLKDNERLCIENYVERYINHTNNVISIFNYKLIKK